MYRFVRYGDDGDDVDDDGDGGKRGAGNLQQVVQKCKISINTTRPNDSRLFNNSCCKCKSNGVFLFKYQLCKTTVIIITDIFRYYCSSSYYYFDQFFFFFFYKLMVFMKYVFVNIFYSRLNYINYSILFYTETSILISHILNLLLDIIFIHKIY